MSKKKLIVITGPTSVGKTTISLCIAKQLNTEIVSCDSRQFFRELKIGTAPPSPLELKKIKHHFIHHLSITQDYNVGLFEKDAINKITTLFQKYNKLILVGGSGLYIDAICKGIDLIPDIKQDVRQKIIKEYNTKGLTWLQGQVKDKDPEYYKIVDKKNPQRLMRAIEVFESCGKKLSSFRKEKVKKRGFEIIKIGLSIERPELYKLINKRVERMMEKGLVCEAKRLIKYRNKNALQTVGYKEIFDYLDKNCSLEETIEKIKQNTRRFAKRQMTWFKKDKEIKWFSTSELKSIELFIEQQ